jgi:hypothetical protein
VAIRQQAASGSDNNTWRYAAGITAALLSFLLGISLSRILYEGFFPQTKLLGQPWPIFISGLTIAFLGWFLWRTLADKLSVRKIDPAGPVKHPLSANYASWTATAVFLPLTLNLAYLFDRRVNLVTSQFLLFTSLWLMIVFLVRLLTRARTWRWLSYVLLVGFLLPVYLVTLGQTVGTADTFEFQVVVPRLGIVHPTGYPLYLLLSKPFTLIPFNSVAWRVNLATAVFGLTAVCLLYLLCWRLTNWPLTSLLAAVIFGLTPTFWSQAIEAEVYTLHSLLVVAALLLMREIGDWRLEAKIHLPANSNPNLAGSQLISDSQTSNSNIRSNRPSKANLTTDTNPAARNPPLHPYTLTLLLSFTLGLGLTNHLTTIILLPAAVLTVILAYRTGRYSGSPYHGLKAALLIALAFILPLLLYAYLPIRWAAVNGEPMGLARFVNWIIGGRFQGALQLTAWLEDSTRYDIVGRLFADEWLTIWTLILVIVGAAYLLLWQWRYGLLLLIIWFGFASYALNYYVPDLAVFIIPAQLIMAIWWLVGIVAALDLVLANRGVRQTFLIEALFLMAGIIPLLAATADLVPNQVNRSQEEEAVRWAKAVFELPLDENAAILADSKKYPPLYYLQQAEGFRPDLDIVVLPDEASYRADLDARLAAGQTILLARFLPGLAGTYHLSSLGPLTLVGKEPALSPPPEAIPADLSFGPIRLSGYIIEPQSPYDGEKSSITFYWTSAEPLDEVLHVYTRWTGQEYAGPVSSQHPANNTYPTVAWEPGEIIADFHTLPKPIGAPPFSLQVAVAPEFTRTTDLQWQTVDNASFEPPDQLPTLVPIRMQIGPVSLTGVSIPAQARSGDDQSILLTGQAETPEQLSLSFLPSNIDIETDGPESFVTNSLTTTKSLNLWTVTKGLELSPGQYDLVVTYPGSLSNCGWLTRKTAGCIMGNVEISDGQLPEGASNFADKIALLSVKMPKMILQPGGQVPINLTWQALTSLDEDYTVFVQILDENDRIVGQVDSWPVQGTYPTSQWRVGEAVKDPYLVWLKEDLPPGKYRLNVGLYLLETLRRLPVLGEGGAPVDDKFEVPGLVIPSS